MADRRVTATRKDKDGDITALCNSGEHWSPRLKQAAINDIETGTHTYYVRGKSGKRADINVVNDSSGKYLRTDPNTAKGDNLDELPDC